MNEKQLLETNVDKLRTKSYEDLVKICDKKEPLAIEVADNYGNNYQIEISVEYETQDKIRVIGHIDKLKPKRWWHQFVNTNSYGFYKLKDGTTLN